MKRLFSLLLFIFLVILLISTSGCQEQSNNKSKNHKVILPKATIAYEHIDRELHKSDFKHLKKGMSADEVASKIGKPNGLVGSGHAVPFYELYDGSIALLCFDSHLNDNLTGVFITYADGSTEEINTRDDQLLLP